MASRVPAKSILKQQPHRRQNQPNTDDGQRAQAAKDQRNLNIALHHANLIQRQKDITASILDSTVFLTDFPMSNPFSAKDAYTLTKLLEPFQPSDFDSLIEERRIDGKCGYVLCTQAPRAHSMGASASWKLKEGASNFCSNACARKAVYLKAQLSEVPAWERAHGVGQPLMHEEIQLHEDDRPTAAAEDADVEVRRARRAERVDAWRRKVAGDEELARERGEQSGGFRPHEVMADFVVEKAPRRHRPPVPPGEAGEPGVLAGFGAIEGFEPSSLAKFNVITPDGRKDESDED